MCTIALTMTLNAEEPPADRPDYSVEVNQLSWGDYVLRPFEAQVSLGPQGGMLVRADWVEAELPNERAVVVQQLAVTRDASGAGRVSADSLGLRGEGEQLAVVDDPALAFSAEEGGFQIQSEEPLEVTEIDLGTETPANGLIDFTYATPGTLEVKKAWIQVAGGSIALEPFTGTVDQMQLKVLFQDLDLGLLGEATEKIDAAVEGRIDGHIDLRWTGDALVILGGHLDLDEKYPADLQYHGDEGWLVGDLPKDSPQYMARKQVERAMSDLVLTNMTVNILEERADAPILIRVQGQERNPPKGQGSPPIDYTLRVQGDVEEFIDTIEALSRFLPQPVNIRLGAE